MAGLWWALGAGACLPERAGCAHPSAPPPAGPPFDLAAELPLPPAYASDVLWAHAAAGDDFDSARLGRREGAEALFTALTLGGRLGRTALAALAYAEDRGTVLGRTCELAVHATPATTSLLLASILDIVENAPHAEASVDATESAACGTSLRALSERQDQTPSNRDLAQSAFARLELLRPAR